MASSFIQRICKPDTAAEVPQAKIAILTMCAVAQEILAGRMPAAALGGYLSVEEVVDATCVLSKVTDGSFTVDEVERILLLGENEIYSVTVIENLLGITALHAAKP